MCRREVRRTWAWNWGLGEGEVGEVVQKLVQMPGDPLGAGLKVVGELPVWGLVGLSDPEVLHQGSANVPLSHRLEEILHPVQILLGVAWQIACAEDTCKVPQGPFARGLRHKQLVPETLERR